MEASATHRPNSFYMWSLRLLAVAFVFLMGQVAFDAAFTWLWPRLAPPAVVQANAGHPWIQLYANHAWQLAVALLAIAFFAGRDWRRQGGLALVNRALTLRIVARFTVVCVAFLAAVHGTLRLLGTGFPLSIRLTALDIVFFLIFQLLVSGVTEEIWYRGMGQGILGAYWRGIWRIGPIEMPVAGVWAAVIFAAGHLPFTVLPPWAGPGLGQPFVLLNAFAALLLGLFYGWARWRTGDVWAAAISHGIFNFISAVMMIGLALLN